MNAITHTNGYVGTEVLTVTNARAASGYALELTFNDGSTKCVDFAPFLASSTNPLIRRYLEPAEFNRFSVRDGDLMWGDYDLVFPVADLYEGRL